jgi:S-DNA-T family DNA segregation ATPase FtsK/SpoIIIE
MPAFLGGLILVFLGAYLFASLASYDPRAVPVWAPLISTTSVSKGAAANLGGPVGALLAGYLLFFLGAAAYLLSVAAIGYGGAKWFVPGYRLRDKVGWGLLMVLLAACLLQLQPFFLIGWKQALRVEGPGGFIGLWLGKKALYSLLGTTSIFLLIALYGMSLLFAITAHPLRDIRLAWAAFLVWRKSRRQAQLAKLDPLSLNQELTRDAKKKAAKLTKLAKKKGITLSETEPELPFPQDLPEPEIIDSTAPAVPSKKPKLSELRPSRDPKESFPTGLIDVRLKNYQLPGPDLLDIHDEADRVPLDREELRSNQGLIIETLAQFGIRATPGTITKGPTITRYEVYPDVGVRVDKIVALERDIARATCAERINILAPIPGKDTVGIEIANSKKVKVTLRELFEKDVWRETTAKLPLALGMDVYGHTIIGDLSKMPHLLVAGTTGSGKSVCINSIIASLLFRYSPENLRFIMIDPKVVEMQIYNTLPHLITPVVTDPKKVLLALRWVVDEMELRYRIFAKSKVKNISAFNERPLPKSQAQLDAEKAAADAELAAAAPPAAPAEDEPPSDPPAPEPADPLEEIPSLDEPDQEEDFPPPPPVRVPRSDEMLIPDRMPFIVVIIDELADLMQTAPADVESAIARITQMARAAGIHMIVATQTPRADVVTGIIKANIPSRIAFQVASKIDSRVILDENGAEKLLGQGDMLYLPPGTSKYTRAQGVLVTEEEIHRIVDFVSKQGEQKFDSAIHEKLTSTAPPEEDVSDEDEALCEKCREIIRQENRASTSMLQRRLKLGYTRAARVMDILEQRGVVGPKDGAKDREILVDLNEESSF